MRMFREANEQLFEIVARHDYFPDDAEVTIDITWPFYGDSESNEFIQGRSQAGTIRGRGSNHVRSRLDRHASGSGNQTGVWRRSRGRLAYLRRRLNHGSRC